jgi:hypothetical protein
MSLPDDETLDFDFDELELDETNEEIEASDGQDGQEGSEGGGRESEAGNEGTETGEGAQRQLSRSERRIQALANKSRDTERRAIEAETRNQLLQQQLMAMQQPAQQYDPRAEQEYVASLDPVERIQYTTARQMQYMQQTNQQQQYMMLEMMDRTAYQTKAAANPVYKKFEAEVEQMRAAEASKGRHFNREDILAFLIGQKMLNNKKSVKAKTAKVTRKATQTTRPGNASTDVSSGRGSDSERNARAKRVANYTF